MLRLFAPVMPFVADEVWGWFNHGSIHCAKWPETIEVSQSLVPEVRAELLELASWVLGSVRKAKSESKVSMTAQVARVVVTDQKARLDMLASIARDIESAGCLIAPIELVESEAGQEPAVLVELLI
jgi:valyl-tRNA synthetase